MNNDAQKLQQLLQQAELVFDTAEIEEAILELAQRLRERLVDPSPLALCVMQGGLMFTSKIMPHLPLGTEFDYIHVTRYRDNTRGGSVEWRAFPSKALNGRTVLILDDILDEGHTLEAIVQYCLEQGAREVITAVLLQKKHGRLSPGMHCDYVALQVEDRYVFGYGMDYRGKLRHLDHIYAVASGET